MLDSARRYPAREAVKDDVRSLSYAQLADEVARAATGLAARGVAPGARIAIRLATSADALVTALGCLVVGAVFVPLPPTDPPARLRSILGDCAPSLVIGRPDDSVLGDLDRPVASFAEMVADRGDPAPPLPPGPRPAYCIYTSGTTGMPKGVLVGTEGFANAIEDTINFLGFDSATRALCISAFHFDGSFSSLFATPAVGGALVIRRREPMVLPRAFVGAILDEQVDVAFCSPGFLRLLLVTPVIDRLRGSSLRKISFGGEASYPKHLRALHEALPGVRFYNRYGPTETVIAVTSHEITPHAMAGAVEVPIGRPHPGVTFALFDDEDEPVTEPGVPGKLYIGGDQLMDGYFGDPELTARVLRHDLLPGQVLYQSGDIVKLDASGDYVYCGRADRVVKRNGVRISLDEIERVLQDLPQVTSAASILVAPDDDVRILAFATTDAAITPDELIAALRERLPGSMIPDAVHVVDAFGMTPAGKIDYRELARSHSR